MLICSWRADGTHSALVAVREAPLLPRHPIVDVSRLPVPRPAARRVFFARPRDLVELALDDRSRLAFVGELDGVSSDERGS
jgi:hypothetical protein